MKSHVQHNNPTNPSSPQLIEKKKKYQQYNELEYFPSKFVESSLKVPIHNVD